MQCGKYIVQVLPRAVLLVVHETQEKLQHMPIDLDGQIVEAVECDPFLAILSSKGSLLNLILVEKSDGSYMLQVTKSPPQKPEVAEKRITHITMMNDAEGVFVLGKGKQEKQETKLIERQSSTKELQKAQILTHILWLPEGSTIIINAYFDVLCTDGFWI